MRPIAVGCLLFVAAAALLAAPDDAMGLGPTRPHMTATRVVDPPKAASRSIGAPNEGHLEGGAHLETSPSLRILPSRAGLDNRWGLPALVGMLERSSKQVDKHFPGSVMTVGDLSRRGGGEVSHHHSHESGRDADVPFYLTSESKQFQQGRFLSIDENGLAEGSPHVHFDDARNWALVSAWLNDSQATVRQIFVAEHLRQRLLKFAASIHAPQSLRNRAAIAMLQPRKGLPHDDHFHVRIGCPAAQKGTCIEYAMKDVGKKHERVAKSHPVVAKTRKRGGTSTTQPPPLVGVVPAEDDFNDAPSPDDAMTDDPDSDRDVDK